MIFVYLVAMFGVFGMISGDIAPPQTVLHEVLPEIASTPPPSEKTAPIIPLGAVQDRSFVATFSSEVRIDILSRSILNDEQDAAYTNVFVSEGYYSAFAISKAGYFGYSTQANSIAEARMLAIAECQQHVPICRIYAETLPLDYVQPLDGVVTLSSSATEYYLTLPERPPFAAMAASGDGAYSMGWNRLSQTEIDDFVRDDCEASRVFDVPGYEGPVCMLLYPPH